MLMMAQEERGSLSLTASCKSEDWGCVDDIPSEKGNEVDPLIKNLREDLD
jgi:hypothetical protein